MYKIIKGDLIKLALEGEFDVVAHGCNCFCRMKRGIAPLLAEQFSCDRYPLENQMYAGDINKLGRIEWMKSTTKPPEPIVVNMYTQYHWQEPSRFGTPLDYDALKLCFLKLNKSFSGDTKKTRLGIPWIGCGLAGGSKIFVEHLVKIMLVDLDVTIVELDK